MLQVADQLEGQLTASLHVAEQDHAECRQLLEILEMKAGRIVMNGFPTGLEVCRAMNHGGPFPATTHSGTTSVGSGAIRRFLRPVCYQNFLPQLLPSEISDAES